jgi:AraC-like DNA-binding protein
MTVSFCLAIGIFLKGWNHYEKSGVRKFFIALIQSFFAVMLVPTLTAIILSVTIVNMVGQKTRDFQNRMCQDVYDEMSDIFYGAKSRIQSLARNDLLFQYASSGKRNYYDEYKIRESLNNSLFGTAQSIQSIYLYLPQYDYIISDQKGAFSSAFFKGSRMEDQYNEWMSYISASNPYPRIYYVLDHSDGSGISPYVLIVYDVTRAPTGGTLIIELNLNPIYRSMTALADDEIYAFAYSGDKTLLSTVPETLHQELIGYAQRTSLSVGSPYNSTASIHWSSGQGESFNLRHRFIEHSNINLVFAVAVNAGGLRFAKNLSIFALIFSVTVTTIMVILIAIQRTNPITKIFELLSGDDENLQMLTLENSIETYVDRHHKMQALFHTYATDFRDAYFNKLLSGQIAPNAQIQQYVFRLYNVEIKGHSICAAIFILEDTNKGSSNDSRAVAAYRESGDASDTSTAQDVIQTILEAQARMSGYSCYFVSSEELNQFSCIVCKNPENPSDANAADDFSALFCSAEEKIRQSATLPFHFFVGKTVSDVLHIHDSYTDAIQQIAQYEKNTEREWVKQKSKLAENCIKLIQTQYQDANMSLSGISEQLSVSSTYLSRTFKEEVGIGLLDYIHQYRILVAKQIIETNPNVLVKDVAELVGFSNAATLIRVFKKLEGVTPGEYEKTMINR